MEEETPLSMDDLSFDSGKRKQKEGAMGLEMNDDLGHLQDFIGQDESGAKNDFDFDFSLDDKEKVSPEKDSELNRDQEENWVQEPEEFSSMEEETEEFPLEETGLHEELPLEDHEEEVSPLLMSEDLMEDLPETRENLQDGGETEDLESWEQDFDNLQSEEALELAAKKTEKTKIQDAIPYQEEKQKKQEPVKQVKPEKKEPPVEKNEPARSEKMLSDSEVMKIQQNLNKLPVNLALHLRDILIKPQFPAKTKELITQELVKDYPNTFRLEALAGLEGHQESGSKTSFMPVLKALAVLVIAAFIISLGYFL